MILDFIELKLIFLKIYILHSTRKMEYDHDASIALPYRHQWDINETHIDPLDVASNWTLLFEFLEASPFSGTSTYSNLRESRVKVIGP